MVVHDEARRDEQGRQVAERERYVRVDEIGPPREPPQTRIEVEGDGHRRGDERRRHTRHRHIAEPFLHGVPPVAAAQDAHVVVVAQSLHDILHHALDPPMYGA